MATNAELLTSVNNGIAAVLSELAAGNPIVEWREGGVWVKKNTTHELLAELRRWKADLEGATATRFASVATFGGSV